MEELLRCDQGGQRRGTGRPGSAGEQPCVLTQGGAIYVLGACHTPSHAGGGPSVCLGSCPLPLTFAWLLTLNLTFLKEAFPALLVTVPARLPLGTSRTFMNAYLMVRLGVQCLFYLLDCKLPEVGPLCEYSLQHFA